MSCLIDICFICLKRSNNLVLIKNQDINGRSFEDKLKYFVPERELNSDILEYICAKCASNLDKSCEFKQICLQNITAYKKYAQQITTIDSSNKLPSVDVRRDLIHDEATISNENDSQNVINEIKKEIKEEKMEFDDIKDENISEDYVTHIEKETFTCVVCNKSFRVLHQLKDHQSTKHTAEISHICKVCHNTFNCLRTWDKHKLVHTAKKYICEICNKSFGQLLSLNSHQITHTGEKPHTCEVCNKSFLQFNSLKFHKLVHTGEKTCDVCNRTFGQMSYLKKHKRIHAREKKYTCEACNISFRQFRTLKQHRVTHFL